jgi:DNA-binding NarL/FixJ family response regulator
MAPDASTATRESEKKAAEGTRVLLVDDHPMIREGFRRLLEKNGEFEVVGEVDSVEGALEALTRSRVEMVVMDIQLPGLDGVEGTKLVKAKYPDVKVVIVSSYGEAYLLPAISAGADGYLLKTQSPWELVKCMHQAALGHSPVDPGLTRHLMDQATVATSATGDGLPTDRQQEVLRLVSDGIPSKDVASRLNISETTLKREFRNIFNFLGVNDRAHAVAEACRRNLI